MERSEIEGAIVPARSTHGASMIQMKRARRVRQRRQ
jgi:hypothetical protein